MGRLGYDDQQMNTIPYSKQDITESDINAVSRVMASDYLTQGPEVSKFEDSLQDTLGVKKVVVCSSGTAALHLSYAALEANPESIALVPAITFSATANAIRYFGGSVQFCDVDPCTGLICIDSLKDKIQKVDKPQLKKNNFVVPVSMSGATAPLDECKKIAERSGFKLIEDASHSILSSKVNETGKTVRSASCEYTETACLSFHPVKHLCCGEGGAIATNSLDLSEKLYTLRSHGIKRPYDENHITPWFYEQIDLGWNYRLSDMHAALGRSQLKRLHQRIKRRQDLAIRYNQELGQYPFRGFLKLPPLIAGHSWHLYVVHFPSTQLRNQAHKFLKQAGIQTQIHYIPLYRHPYFEKINGRISLPGAEEYYKGCLSIPLFPSMTDEQQTHVIHSLAQFLENC